MKVVSITSKVKSGPAVSCVNDPVDRAGCVAFVLARRSLNKSGLQDVAEVSSKS